MQDLANKQYNHDEVEGKWMQKWLDSGYFKAQVNENTEKFSIALPPPNVTGELHMGHALGGTIQDVLIRYNRMLGKDVLWQIGTDHAGIGTQIVVEKNLKKTEGKSKEDLGRDQFIERVKLWKEEYGNKIIEQMKLLGFSPDYDRVRYTMDDHYADAVKNAFAKYYQDGVIYRGNRIVNWCPKCLTSLSDLELDKEESKKILYEIKYYIDGSDDFLVVATTRPETMFGDTGVAINPDDERYRELAAKVKAEPGSVQLKIPLTDRLVPLVLDEHVKTDFGTGALKVTPAHDANDYEIAQRQSLPQLIAMDKHAKMLAIEEVPEKVKLGDQDFTLHGMDRYEARNLVVQALAGWEIQEGKIPKAKDQLKIFADKGASGQIQKISEYQQEKDLHDRCATEIEPYLSDQWYVNMQDLAKASIDLVCERKQSQFTPERYTSIFKNWLENIQDWCISRQIWWGHRIPVFFYETEAGKLKHFVDLEANETDLPLQDSDGNCLKALVEKKQAHIKNGGKASDQVYIWQDPDVLDTWFSSALWPFETLKSAQGDLEITELDKKIYDKFYPTDVLATAREIINLWVTRMIFSSIYFESEAEPVEPYKDILIHPVVQTPDGKRMSKSKGNAIDPLDMIKLYGADASRMWYASVGVLGNQDVRFPGAKDKKTGWKSDQFEQYRKFCNKLFNAAKFTIGKLGEDFQAKPIADLDKSKLNIADIWVLDKFTRVLDTIDKAFASFDLGTVQKEIYEFLWFDFCDWYIELTKIESGDTETQKQILFYILEASLRVLHPIAPFITEEIWQLLNSCYKFNQGHESICFASYPKAHMQFIDESDNAKRMAYVVDLISSLRNIRQSLQISWSNQISVYFKSENDFEKNAILAAKEFLVSIVKIDELKELDQELEKPVNLNHVGETQITVPLAGLVDLDKLKLNLENKISKVDKDINVLESRLNSDNFVKNAPAEKLEEAREALEKSMQQKSVFEKELAAL